jgi:tRNA 5-methylaminomethyl-2-thiouridine biosynthesis bifunctional protein
MMAAVFTPLSPSVPAFASANVPFSERYDDVYYAAQGALEQTRHVFLQGNGLPERWRGRSSFTVCETGFGLGLNLLALWDAWRGDPQRSTRLHMVSIEAHPFSREHMCELLLPRVPQELKSLAEELLANWPPLLPGLHRIDLQGGAVTLTLAFGFALDLVPQLSARVDAYFLDGFSPDRNPDMWSAPLMKSLARLAAPGATASSWTSAGVVRRALQEAGFIVEKRKGFVGKRHMTVARYEPAFQPRQSPAPLPAHAERHAVVVGAGVAGAGVAHALALRGWRVTVLDPSVAQDLHAPSQPAAQQGDEHTKQTVPQNQAVPEHQQTVSPSFAGEHLAAALTPLISRDDNARARLTRAGALRAQARWQPWMDGQTVLRCGTVQQAKSDARMADLHSAIDALGFPPDWVRAVGTDEAAALAGVRLARGGAYFADGLRIRPRLLCAALLAHPLIEVRKAGVDRIAIASALTPVRSSADADVGAGPGAGAAARWQAFDASGNVLAEAEVMVLAASTNTPGLLRRSQLTEGGPRFFEQNAVVGQITLLPQNTVGAAGTPRCIVAGEGYVLPPVAEKCVTGSTYVYDCDAAQVTEEGHRVNVERAAKLLPDVGSGPIDASALQGWAGWRAVLQGRLPVVAQVPQGAGLWVVGGFASRGLTWSALAGDVVAATLEGEPMMLERDLLATIEWR